MMGSYQVSWAVLFGMLLAGAVEMPRSALAIERPNFVVILADDLGFGDVSCNNPDSKIPTPHVDRLAAGGVRFTDAHSPSAVCTPTRYGLLTGRYAWRTRMTAGVLDGFSPPLIEPERLTVASLLKQHGYHSACIGKWHLGLQWTRRDGTLESNDRGQTRGVRVGDHIDYSQPFTGGPLALGFDRFFGISASLNMSPFCFLDGDRPWRLPVLPQERIRDDNFAATDQGVRSPDFTIRSVLPRLAGEAVAFLEHHQQSFADQPFFLYAPLTSPHLPVVVNDEYLGKSQAGEYGDFVFETDAFVGAVLETLDRLNVSENTFVLFTSDNGGLYHYWQPLEADDVAHYRPSGRAEYIRQFGHQGNAHWRGTKSDIWEGGHRVPFVIRWPGHAPAGAVSKQLVELTDLIATLAAVLEHPLRPGDGPDSLSFLPALLDPESTASPRTYAVHHSGTGVFAIRSEDWKLIPDHRGSGGFSVPRSLNPAEVGGPSGQLYNLAEDPAESRNLYASHPEVVARLSKLLNQIRSRK